MLIEKEIPGRKGGKKRNRALKILLAFCSLGALAAAVYTHSYVTRISSRSLFPFFFFISTKGGKISRARRRGKCVGRWCVFRRNKSNITSPPSPIYGVERRLSFARDLRLNGR